MNRHSQKGSALLIVLGFLSFMVVSAVAFAIWMRNERLPSSALRRSVANRYLVKAALAQAMSRVDDAIRSHPYPGAWSTNNTEFGTKNVNDVYRDKIGLAYDWWESRVFMPPDPEGVKQQDESNVDYPRYAPVTKTVSVLNIEALGYLPPPIVNDVRLLSRSSWAAQWEYFNFDAGRYAFCAVNVSDLLDINKIAANSPRTSAAAARPESSGKAPPPSRFSLAYLFRSGGNNFANPSGHDTFDDLTHKGLPDWPGAPLVSLLDYNLAMEDKMAGTLFSPFYFLFCGRTTSGGFYGGGQGSQGVNGAARQLFVTDSWFPTSDYALGREKSNKQTDIAKYQPFKGDITWNLKKGKGDKTLESVYNNRTEKFREQIIDYGYLFSRIDWYTLFDYLDEDNLPLSLAMPCAERVPMITSLGFSQKEITVKFKKGEEKEETKGNEVWKYQNVDISVETPELSAALVFPFKDGSGADPQGYKVEAFARLVFVDEGDNDGNQTVQSLRDDPSFLRDQKGCAYNFRPVESDWRTAGDPFKRAASSSGDYSRDEVSDCLLLTMFDSQDWEPVKVETVPNVYAKGVRFQTRDTKTASVLSKIDIYEKDPENPEAEPKLKGTKYQINLHPFDAMGNRLTLGQGEMDENQFKEICGQHNIRPYFLVWARVKDTYGDTVDMVPATCFDDRELNKIGNEGDFRESADAFGHQKGDPLLFFPNEMTFTYQKAMDALGGGVEVEPDKKAWMYQSCYALDPRYNWAPENWWFSVDGNPSGNDWYEAVFKDGGILDLLANDEFGGVADNPRADRARDPFLFVSNLGYLQSVGELAFLPHLSVIENTTQTADWTLDEDQYNGGRRVSDGTTVAAFKTMPCAQAAWKSYQSFRTNPQAFEFGANVYRRGLVNGSRGFYVNPFTQSKEVMLAAFANTPPNYWMAGTNYLAEGKDKVKMAKFEQRINGKPAMFEANNQGIRYSADELAKYMMHRYEDLANMLIIKGNVTGPRSYLIQKVWEDMFDALDWGGRMDPDTRVDEIYEQLNDYLSGGGSASKYKEMYTQKNAYGALNSRVADEKPGIELVVDRAIHKDEFADPLYAYRDNQEPTRNPKDGSYVSDVERMFLHSYWRDCFANRQQLFLIFVRAESTALGGNGEGTPAQQGGRAVALVWRDPEAPTGDDVYEAENQDWNENDSRRHPHKMRILFYRQLD